MIKALTAAALALALPSALPGIAFAREAAAPAASKHYSTADTLIGDLLDNPETKAVLERNIPQVISNERFAMARPMTFRAIQSMAGDMLSDAMLDKIDADLAKIPVKN